MTTRWTTITATMVMALSCALSTGCGYEAIQPGQRALRYDPHNGGLKAEVLGPGLVNLGWCFLRDCGRLDTFDVTYQTKREELHTPSSEGLALDLRMAVIFRPIVSELYALDSEISGGHEDYYEEVVGPEFRSAARSVFARHSYTSLLTNLEKVEDEVETEVRRRIHGKHIEIASITLEQIGYAPEIANAVQQKLVAEQEAARQKSALENQALREKLVTEQKAAQARLKTETEANQARLEAQTEAETARIKADAELQEKQNERKVAEEQAALDRVRTKAEAENRVAKAKGEEQERVLLAHAEAEENRAKALAQTPLTVEAQGYEALGKLGGNGTTVYLGDWSRAPQFLFGRSFMPYMYPAGPAPANAPTSTTPPNAGKGGKRAQPASTRSTASDDDDNPYDDKTATRATKYR